MLFRSSTITAVCGAFSHSKLVEPLDILKPSRVTIGDCRDAAATQIITTKDGRQLRTGVGATATYKFIAAGEVVLDKTNVACEGGEMKVQGKRHENILDLVTVSFRIIKVEVTKLEDRHLRVKDGILPSVCSIDAGGCDLDDLTLVIDTRKIDFCPYVEVRRCTFSQVKLEHRELLVNDAHKLLFELRSQVALPTSCVNVGKIRATNFEQLFLMAGGVSTGQTVHELGGRGVDFELET